VRCLILSDLHANWEALQAVLEDAAGRYDRILCCGDLVGYGADPNAIVEWCRARVHTVIRGNHDKAVASLEGLEWFNPAAQAATVWTHHQLTGENRAYLAALPRGPLTVDGIALAHGAPADEDEYLVDTGEARQAFAYTERPVTFFGHTHIQGGFRSSRRRTEKIGRPGARAKEAVLDLEPDTYYLINPGSVGQPRDGDPRAAYVLYDPADGFLCFRRVEYPVELAQRKIRQAGLPDLLAVRLAAGR